MENTTVLQTAHCFLCFSFFLHVITAERKQVEPKEHGVMQVEASENTKLTNQNG